jgi:hypothetical protein
MVEWYWMKHGQKHGPVSTKLLKQLANAGHLAPTDKIWREGLSGWVSASKANGLEFGQASRNSKDGTRTPSTRPAEPVREPASALTGSQDAGQERSDLEALANAASADRSPRERGKETRRAVSFLTDVK